MNIRTITRQEKFWVAAIVAVTAALVSFVEEIAPVLVLGGIILMVFFVPRNEKKTYIDLSKPDGENK